MVFNPFFVNGDILQNGIEDYPGIHLICCCPYPVPKTCQLVLAKIFFVKQLPMNPVTPRIKTFVLIPNLLLFCVFNNFPDNKTITP